MEALIPKKPTLSQRGATPALLVLLLVAAAVYWPGLAGGFVFDDYASIVNNASLRLFDGSLASLADATAGGLASPWGRPLSLASFAFNSYLTPGDPYYFKLTNLFIHLANGLLVYALVKQVWPHLIAGASNARWAALWVAAAWLLHPINLTPVLFVVQRMTSLASFFTLAAICLYLFGRQHFGWKRWSAIGASLLLLWPAGVLSKETALVLPLFLLLCEWQVFRSFDGIPQKHRWLVLGGCILLAAGVLAASWPLIGRTYLLRDFTLVERLMTEARVLWLYVAQIAFPQPDLYALHHDDVVISKGLLAPADTILAILGCLLLGAIAIMQRTARPWLTFAILWFLIGHVLESSFLGLEIAYEHRNYIPSIGLIFGIAALFFSSSAKKTQVPRMALAACFLVLCGVITGVRAMQWGDEYIRTQIESNTHPNSARTHSEAARAILDRTLPTGFMSVPAYNMARIHYQRAAKFDPHSKAALVGVLFVDCAVGAKKDAEVLQTLLDRLATARMTWADQVFIQSLSDILANNMLCLSDQEVEALFTAALSNPMASGKIRGMLHALAMDYAAAKLGSLPRARIHALAAVKSDPGSVPLRINLIRVLVRLNDIEAAKRQYAELSRLPIPAINRSEVENMGLGLGDPK
ncbi:MAG TPA: hypothetical protein VF522_03915 [Ramlibacter sp.]|uniref:hypothetical protein n=1 Tax=Ramlibacter sp. TaxID=1917967 RepID=UPI002ED5602B